jgi:nitric-oxide synthase, bacterial
MQLSAKDLFDQASTFIQQFFEENELEGKDTRINQISTEILKKGTYHLTEEEVIFGAKLAWRNSNRCIGRLFWKGLKIRDRRQLDSAEAVFEDILEHLDYATNGGKIRSTISIYPSPNEAPEAPRILNKQVIRFAGYRISEGQILGDPDSVDFTSFCQSLGWKPPHTAFDLLPLVIQMGNQEPKWFEIPEEKAMRVPISHPEFSWFKDLNIQWYAVPLISDMRLEIGGISFPCAPFNGWYMLTEIAVRNLADAHRYNLLPQVAEQMKLDTKHPRSLWKEKALLVLQEAVLHSFQEYGVTLVDHHTASEQFLEFCRIEQGKGRKVQAEWAWIVPPSAGSTMGVFHQEWDNLELRPNFFYQTNPALLNLASQKVKPSSCPFSVG